MINIISTFYVSKYGSHLDNERTEELCNTLLNNINSDHIEKIHLFLDDEDAVEKLTSITNSDKVKIISVGKKPIYKDFFEYILNNIDNKICMLTNADIYLADCEIGLIENLIETKSAYALSRYEWNMENNFDRYCGSHDCYIFNSKFISRSILNSSSTEFYQNTCGIETRIISALLDEGLTVYNPCYQIKIVHLHKSEHRRWVDGWHGLHICGDMSDFENSRWCIKPAHL